MSSDDFGSLNDDLESKANQYKREIVQLYPQFDYVDLEYVTTETIDKVSNLGLPTPNCNINTVFENAIDRNYHTKSYCVKNCGFRCLRGLSYETIADYELWEKWQSGASSETIEGRKVYHNFNHYVWIKDIDSGKISVY